MEVGMAATTSIRASSLFSIALLGAAGGAINASLCYAQFPVAAGGTHFKWHIIPAGAAHGAILAAVTVACAWWLLGKAVWARLLAAPFIGWIIGYLSYIPLNRSAFDEPWLKSVTWLFDGGGKWTEPVFMTFQTFGLVALIYYLCLALGRFSRRCLGVPLLYACSAGVLGSLWWWVMWEPWYLSLIHGTIWGILVGYGTWRAVQAVAPEDIDITSLGVGARR